MKGTATTRLFIAVLFFAGPSFAEEGLEKLTDEHRKWLEEDVAYIIAKREREVFLLLDTVEGRNRFIEVFWERRDPDPATPANEFKIEHYRRIDYANRVLGRDSPRPGWKTDRGRYYIILGQPQETQRYDGLNEVVTCEIWFYQGDTSLGMPPRFNLLFFKDNDIGEYKLYHPLANGPEALLRAGEYFRTNQNIAVDALEIVSMDLARASLTVDLTEPVGSFLSGRSTRQPLLQQARPSIGVDAQLAIISESPLRRLRTDYLDAYLRYKEKVSAEYSFRYVPSRQQFAVLVGPRDTPFFHFSVELDPQYFTLQADREQARFYTTLDLSMEIRDRNGTLVASYENSSYLELSQTRMEQVRGAPFAYHDDFPLVPGEYRVSWILRNRATKQFTASERDLQIEPVAGHPSLSPILLGYKREITAGTEEEHRSFQMGNQLLYPAVDGIFASGETAWVFLQAPKARPDQEIRWTLWAGLEKLSQRVVRVGAYGGAPAIEAFPLVGLAGGTYPLQAELLDPSGNVVAERTADLTVSPRASIPRAGFVYRHSFNAETPGLLDLAEGQQYLALGRIAEAEAAFSEAVAAGNPRLPQAQWKLAYVLILLQKPAEALELLLPLKDTYADEPEVVEGLGYAYYFQGDFAEAVGYLEHFISLRAPDAPLLNTLGDSYQKLGEWEEARKLFERSLELNPAQEAVRQRLASFSKDP